MAWCWHCEPDKDRTVSFISHRSFKSNQLKLLEILWIDLKNTDSSPRWYLESLSWCGSGLHKSIWSYLVFHDLDVPTLRQCQKVSKDHSGMFCDIPWCWRMTSTTTSFDVSGKITQVFQWQWGLSPVLMIRHPALEIQSSLETTHSFGAAKWNLR